MSFFGWLFVFPSLYDMDHDTGAAAICISAGKASCLELEEASFSVLETLVSASRSPHGRKARIQSARGLGLLLHLVGVDFPFDLRQAKLCTLRARLFYWFFFFLVFFLLFILSLIMPILSPHHSHQLSIYASEGHICIHTRNTYFTE